jgi:hypothetical protein
MAPLLVAIARLLLLGELSIHVLPFGELLLFAQRYWVRQLEWRHKLIEIGALSAIGATM